MIPTGADSSAGIAELPSFLKRWMQIQEEINVLNAELRQRRTQSVALKSVILRIMESNKVAQLNTSKGTILHKTRETSEKLSNSYLLRHCKDFFEGDETKAQALVDYLESNRATTLRSDLKLQPIKPNVSSPKLED